MAVTRLDSDERRKAIVAAAVPLFARKGFAGTTTKELAEGAGISEALLFRHFPSKKHLYGEILRLGCEGDPALERLATLEPSTATLVHMIHFMVRYFLLGAGVDRAEIDTRLRLMLHSFLEDGEYARELFDRIFERVHPLFAASIEAATAAGDLKPGSIASANRFWFSQHVAAMVAFVLLPGRASVPYQGTPNAGRGGELVHSARHWDEGGCARHGARRRREAAAAARARLIVEYAYGRRTNGPRGSPDPRSHPTRSRRRRTHDHAAAEDRPLVRHHGIAAGSRAWRPLWIQPVPRARHRDFLRQQQAAAGADQRDRGQDRGGAAVCPSHRLARCGASGHDQPRNRRPRRQDIFRAGDDREGRRSAGPAQRRSRAGRSEEL